MKIKTIYIVGFIVVNKLRCSVLSRLFAGKTSIMIFLVLLYIYSLFDVEGVVPHLIGENVPRLGLFPIYT